MFYSEKEAEDFLEKNGFKVVKRAYAKAEKELKGILKRFKFPLVMKIAGKKIVHKNALGGVFVNINNFGKALMIFDRFKKIRGFEEVIIQEQLGGKEKNSSKPGQIKEILIGVKNTRDFGHVVCVGSGGTNTEKLNDVSFRIFPFDEKEAKRMLFETKISKTLKKEEKKAVENNIMKACNLIKNNPELIELDINPLIVNKSIAIVVDARMVKE